MSTSLLASDKFTNRFADKMVLVDGYSRDDLAIMQNYGYKKVITLKELLSLEVDVSIFTGLDL